ncbi:MAG: DUF5818 domain-containing protein [Terriglobales bacterium]
MNKRTCSFCSSIALALLIALGLSTAPLHAQQSDQQSPNQATGQQSQPPSQQTAPPDTQAQSQSPQTQTFAGTIVKSGDKYVLQDASGKAYDVDRQDLVKSHEGKKVRINGMLDPDGKTIHVK